MQRSDITNINKLFLESRLEQFYVSDWVEGYIDSHSREIEFIDSWTVAAPSMSHVIVNNIIKTRLDRAYDLDEHAMYMSPDYAVIYTSSSSSDDDQFSVVSDQHIEEERVQWVLDNVCIKSNRVKISDLLAKFEYKATATKGVDPDLGFGDLLDVL